MEERTGWQGQNESQIVGQEKRNGRLVGAAETSKERAEWRRLQRKNLNILGLPKRKEWPQCHRESSWQERRSRPCQKEKEQSRQSKAPDHEGERVKVGESRTLARKGGIRARAWRGKGGLHRERRARSLSLFCLMKSYTHCDDISSAVTDFPSTCLVPRFCKMALMCNKYSKT